jgi:hypothetical protein
MAENINQENNNPDNSHRAIQLLQEATMLLSSSGSASTAPHQDTPSRPPVNTQTQSQSVLQNLRTIFSPYARTSVSPASEYQQAQRPRSTYRPYYTVKEMWTHKLFCLSQRTQNRVPSKSVKIALQNCGLGRRKICFPSKANYSTLEEKLLEEYPKLADAGGFKFYGQALEATLFLLFHHLQLDILFLS